MRRAKLLLVAACLIAPMQLSGQTGEALIRQIGGTPAITDPDFAAPKDLVYKMAWHVTLAPEQPTGIADGFRTPANFFRLMDSNGVPRSNVKLAIIVHGTATPSLLNNAAYRARTGADNASIALLTALHEAGVQIIVCGQALINRNVPRGELLPFVKVATTAGTAHAILAAQGYEVSAP